MKNTQRILKALPVPARAIFIALLAFGLTFSQVKAQQITVGSGVHIVNNAHVNSGCIVNKGTIHNGTAGEILIKGNWQNDGACTGTASSTVTFAGTATQQIGGSSITTFENLNLNNSAGFSLAKDARVNGVLNFQNGIITTGTNLLTVGETGTITNAAATGYVEGKMANTFAAASSKTFPIGKGGNYRPLTLQFSALTGTSVIEAEQFETLLTGDLPENTTLMTTGRHWKLNQTGGSELAYSITLDPTDYTPARPVVMLKQDNGFIISATTTTPTYTNSSAFTSFSEFGLGEACLNPDDGGLIAGEQYSCTSFIPEEIKNEELPSGHIGALDYQWQTSITGSDADFEDILGANDDSFSPGTVTQTIWYRRLARVDCDEDWDEAVISNMVKITVYTALTADIAEAQIICEYTAPEPLNSAITGGSGVYTKTWQVYKNAAWENIPNANHGDYSPGTLSQTTSYRLVVNDGVCDPLETVSITITVENVPQPGSLTKHPDVDEVKPDEIGSVSATLATTGSGGNGYDILRYRTHDGIQWGVWQNYTAGDLIGTASMTVIEVRTYRDANGCEPSDFSEIARWNVYYPEGGPDGIKVYNQTQGIRYFTNIQHAVDESGEFDVIEVYEDTNEENVNIGKQLTIIFNFSDREP